jgi:sialate O-acetylesterase
LVATVLIVAFGVVANADVKPNPIFSDNAVLQRNVVLPVWGTAENGEKVTVSIRNQRVSAVAKDGKWMLQLKPLKEGGPFTMTVSGKNTIEIKNILVGEVWLASGQSNMVWWVNKTENAETVIAASADPMLRHTEVPRACSETPLAETPIAWKEASPETTGDFSGVAYFFAKNLRAKLGCPVGIVNASWGGTRVEAWMSSEALDPLGNQVDRSRVKAGNPPNPNKSSVLYNGLIAPLVPYPIKGAIWYQGESNAGQAYQYHDLFSAMIRDWRRAWGQGDFPFLFVQLAPCGKILTEPKGSNWAELREAQLMTTQTVPNTAMAVITDCGESDNIHPKRKQPVGERLALAARALAYGEKIAYKGPAYKGMAVVGNRAILQFDNAGSGLFAPVQTLESGTDNQAYRQPSGFAVAGEDGKFFNARATIVDKRVIVSADEVAKPTSVRYGWADCPVANLTNSYGLPASPFRTDNYPLITMPKAEKAGK